MSDDFKAILSWTGDSKEVEILANTLKVDDPESFILESITLDDNNSELKVTVISKSPSSLRSTVDDILTCLMAANSTLSTIEFNENE
ncbi:MAG: KEOPS complex subunit Pcc1 [Candidatus Thermoplasmatota archaeon]|nr:KEOPS complex subunit Pcc1 [Candidatus Thermoplasmatota archaeon]MEE3134536.1 KEOPS complex subunit Pcc1 [Candidatus Thermoplasmatota archaeon]